MFAASLPPIRLEVLSPQNPCPPLRHIEKTIAGKVKRWAIEALSQALQI